MKGAGAGRAIGLVICGMLLVGIPVALASLLGVAKWSIGEKIRGDIKKDLQRPGGGVAALLVQQETWEAFIDRVYVREDDGTLESVFWSDRAYAGSPDIEWKDPDTLLIRMKCGDIGHYTNYSGYRQDGHIKIFTIGLEGNKQCGDPSAYKDAPKRR